TRAGSLFSRTGVAVLSHLPSRAMVITDPSDNTATYLPRPLSCTHLTTLSPPALPSAVLFTFAGTFSCALAWNLPVNVARTTRLGITNLFIFLPLFINGKHMQNAPLTSP